MWRVLNIDTISHVVILLFFFVIFSCTLHSFDPLGQLKCNYSSSSSSPLKHLPSSNWCQAFLSVAISCSSIHALPIQLIPVFKSFPVCFKSCYISFALWIAIKGLHTCAVSLCPILFVTSWFTEICLFLCMSSALVIFFHIILTLLFAGIS